MSHDTSYYLIEVVTKAGLTVCHEYLYIKTGRGKRDITIWNTGCILFKNYDIIDRVFSCGMQKFNINNYKQLWKIGHIRRHDIDIMRGVKYDSILNGVPLYLYKQTYGNSISEWASVAKCQASKFVSYIMARTSYIW